MADFCRQCSVLTFGEDFGDLAGMSTPEDTAAGVYCIVICEGCGPIQVDHIGWCVSEDCLGLPHGHRHVSDEEILRMLARVEGAVKVPAAASISLLGALRVGATALRSRLWQEIRKRWYYITGRRDEWDSGLPFAFFDHVDDEDG